MRIKFFLWTIGVVVMGMAQGYSQQSEEIGFLNISGKLQLDYYTHKLGKDWNLSKVGYRGINYNYSYIPSTPTSPSWESSFGQTLFLDISYFPSEQFSGDVGVEVINDYADRLWLPVNFEHRLKLENKNFEIKRADLTYKGNLWSIRFFRGAGHYNWSYEGDLFDLFPEQYETERYLRVSGRPVPEGYEAKLGGSFGDLNLIYGTEAVWDYRSGIYANYKFYLSNLESHIIYRDHIIPYGDPDERMRAVEFSSKYSFEESPLELGIIYQPFRLNRDYEFIQEVAPGSGLLGSKYLKKTDKTVSKDAFGAGAKFTLNPESVFSSMNFKYTYLGLVAGNKQEFSSQVFSKLTRSLVGSVEYMYRKPLIGPIPLVYEGTSLNTGPALFEPRGPDSPFWVSWENKATGWDNREASIISFVFTFDPTPSTWFYKYQPNIGEEWNLNPEEDASVSFQAKYTLAKYFTETDRLLYWDENGHMVWEPPRVTGVWPTKDYVGSFNLISKMILTKWKILFDMGFGEALARNSFSYTTLTDKKKPITGYFTSGVSAGVNEYLIRARYSQDVLGPEDWHKGFGETFDNLYQLGLNRDFGDYINAGIEYTGAREIDKKYFAPDLGDYDEIRLVLNLSFGPLRTYFGSKKSPEERSVYGQIPETETTPPQVSLSVSTGAFSPDGDGADDTLTIEPYATDYSGVKEWEMLIKDNRGNVVKTFSDKGQPPFEVVWDGKDDIYEKVVPEGKYSIELSAKDEYDNSAKTQPIEIIVSIPPKIIIKEVIKEVPKEIKVEETERGLLVSITSKVLFATGKNDVKKSAYSTLDQVVKLLEAYQQNKIAVEGYTDSVGSSVFNQKLSERRAESVANYLIKAGISSERINVMGYGEDKPVESNSSAKGREANRRVEVIILK